jgi:hypothetical protein
VSNFLLLDDRAIAESRGREDEIGKAESAVYARILDLLIAEPVTEERGQAANHSGGGQPPQGDLKQSGATAG